MFNNAEDLILWIESQKRLSPKVSLERFKTICEVYSSPEENINYIHVAGTNGKGSTVSIIKNILQNAGYKVGAYISPYVISFNERISYNNEYISNQDLLDIGNYILSKYHILEEKEINKPSFFEFVTLLAFIYFSRLKELDFVILEVGLGGRLDATNIITPLISVITSISYDHMNVLGNTIEEIAINKLGIVKDNKPLITLKDQRILDIVKNTTSLKNSELTLIDKLDIKNIDASLEYTTFDYKEFNNLKMQLLGFHQTENAVLAIETIKLLKEKYLYKIDEKDIYQGLYKTIWPGRLQVVSKDPIIILDGAHNIDGMTRLTEFLKAVKKDNYLKVVFAVSSDKAKEDMIAKIDEVADEIVFSKFEYRRSDTADHLLELSNHHNKRIEENLEKIVEEVKNEKDKLIIFCGSLYFVSEVFKMF